eukprot:5091191-Prymnesium_polylepis.1
MTVGRLDAAARRRDAALVCVDISRIWAPRRARRAAAAPFGPRDATRENERVRGGARPDSAPPPG